MTQTAPIARAHVSPAVIELSLPYPLSANRYWRPVRIGAHITIVPTKEAKAWKADVASRVRRAGVLHPVRGRFTIEVELYPPRPQDWAKRQRQHGAVWDDTVRCIDLDNANKVLLDGLKGVAIEDDKWLRQLTSRRMEPDAQGERLVVRIRPLHVEQPQASLLEAAA